ncbi:hypothetical protein AX15_002253 [Amanita polypyramis BW_CC]|nr:hypothetical protein AX15_002253 [Amanita polypyramis BW_CC]
MSAGVLVVWHRPELIPDTLWVLRATYGTIQVTYQLHIRSTRIDIRRPQNLIPPEDFTAMVPGNMPDFNVLDNTRPEDTSLPTFMVSTSRGFLPRQEPLATLPPEFATLEKLLQTFPIKTASGELGLLAQNKLGETVDKDLPDLTDEIDKYADNQLVLSALYRDYSFLASGYLLEPCHHEFLRTGNSYGLGRDVLPAQVARPIARVAELTGFKPFMEYAGSYALANYRLLDPSKGLDYDNLALIRAFEHGLDRESSEAGFVLVHVNMVRHSGGLVRGVLKAFKGVELDDRVMHDGGLADIFCALKKINGTMDEMWNKSNPTSYTHFRTFIFGITSQSMFPNGVVYSGVSNGPLSFRGESGANDSMIPLMDNFLQIPMPDTPLTRILEDFRQYRPGNHREFLAWVEQKSRELGAKEYSMGSGPSALLFLRILDGVREFRYRHWTFTREYILRRTMHKTATGGSPIARWLPNQLSAVLELEKEVIDHLEAMDWQDEVVVKTRELVDRQILSLEKEVKKFCNERGEP